MAYIYKLHTHTHFSCVADRVPASVSKNNKTERERERQGKKNQVSQSDRTAECKQQDMNYATRIQLQQVCEKNKGSGDRHWDLGFGQTYRM